MDTSGLLELISLATGSGMVGSLIGGICTIRYTRMQARGAARNAENEATKSVQDVYQEMVEDVRADRADMKKYISELKEDRAHIRKDRDELRQQLDEKSNQFNRMQDEIQEVKKKVAINERRVEIMSPFICGRTSCLERIRTSIQEIEEIESKNTKDK